MSPDAVFISGVSYLPQKRQIVVDFSNTRQKFSRRYAFFPFFFIPNEKELVSALKDFDTRKIKVDIVDSKNIRIIGATFFDLARARDFISKSFNKGILLLEPQRQFLLEKNWGYFDGFVFDGSELVKQPNSAPDVLFGSSFSSLQKSFFDLKKSDDASASSFLEKICLSNILRKNAFDLPSSDILLAELFFENIFFKNRFGYLFDLPSVQGKQGNPILDERLDGFAKINFFGVLCSLASWPFYNVGFDSINCDCCSTESKNISPNSLVQTEFLVDGVYFESCFADFAKDFDKQNDSSKQRHSFQKEWFLNSVPVGPFFSGQKATIPFVDYKFLLEKNFVKNDFNVVQGVWFCKKNESFLSKELKQFNDLVLCSLKNSNNVQSQKIVSNGILFSQMLSSDFSFYYFGSLSVSLKRVLCSSFFVLSEPKSRFFDKRIASCLECIQGGVLRNFEGFAEKNGLQSIKIHDFNAFVKAKNPFFLAKSFCDSLKLPIPEISFQAP